jgi:hypothetical protein
MKKLLQLMIAGLIAATLGLPALAADDEPKPKPKPKAKAKAKAKPKAKAETKPDAKADAPASGVLPDKPQETSDRLNERLRRGAEADQKDRARGTGASSGATPSTPSAPSGVDTTR